MLKSQDLKLKDCSLNRVKKYLKTLAQQAHFKQNLKQLEKNDCSA